MTIICKQSTWLLQSLLLEEECLNRKFDEKQCLLSLKLRLMIWLASGAEVFWKTFSFFLNIKNFFFKQVNMLILKQTKKSDASHLKFYDLYLF